MALNVLEDVLMPGGIILLILTATLSVFMEARDNRVGSAKQMSALHREVLTEYWDNCARPGLKPRSECGDDAVSRAIAGGYADKLQGILYDAMLILNDDQINRLKSFPKPA